MTEYKTCGCDHCKCTTQDVTPGVGKNGQWYCSEDCANGHPDNQCCGHASCGCGKK